MHLGRRRPHRQHAPRHGHRIAKGVDVVSMMKEIYGKKGRLVRRARGGSMHIADLDKG